MKFINLKYFITLIVILLSLVNAQDNNSTKTESQPQKERYIKILKVNDEKEIEAGKQVNLTFKFVKVPVDSSFNFVIKNEKKSVSEKIGLVTNELLYFHVDNTYEVVVTIPKTLPSGSYSISSYDLTDNKVSDSYSVSVKSAEVLATVANTNSTLSNNSTISTNSTMPSNSTVPLTKPVQIKPTSSPNISTANNGEKRDDSFDWKTLCIIASIAIIILLLITILVYCCMRSSSKSKNDQTFERPPTVSEPHLVSSSSPINAIPLYDAQNSFSSNRNSNINVVGNNNMMNNGRSSLINNNNGRSSLINNGNNNLSPQNNYTSPLVSSPRNRPNSKYSDFQQETQDLTEKSIRQIEEQNNEGKLPPEENFNRDTIYSDDEISGPSPSYYYQVFKPHQVYRVLYDFQPSLADEMELQAGDIIRTEETFEDGWAFGINMTTGIQGTFPMNCLEDDYATENDNKSFVSDRSHSRRTSSLNPQSAQALQLALKNTNNGNQSFQKSYYMSQG